MLLQQDAPKRNPTFLYDEYYWQNPAIQEDIESALEEV